MEEEFFCGKCNSLLNTPINLPCAHNVCYRCLEQCLVSSVSTNQNSYLTQPSKGLTKQTDIFNCSSDDSGYLSMYEIRSCLHQQVKGPILYVQCPKCDVIFLVDERGVDSLPVNTIMQSLIELYKCKNSEIDCQLCEETPPMKATIMCEQCCVSYCDDCLKVYHPNRGPLASHSLIMPQDNLCSIRKGNTVLKCTEHSAENISMFCMLCEMPVCYLCFEQGRHSGHEAKALGTMFKERKFDMEKQKQELKDKNDLLKEFITKLERYSSKVKENGVDFESRVVAQMDELMHTLESKKIELINSIAETVSRKLNVLSEQSNTCKRNLKSATALFEYTEAVMKEEDPASFLLISSSLCSRLSNMLNTWIGKEGLTPSETSEMELGLMTDKVMESLSNCRLIKVTTPLKVAKPSIPVITYDKCDVINNTLNLQWERFENKSAINCGYIIEVDDGMKGDFQIVHQTTETVCALGGLQFNSTYRARIKAHNSAGESEPSEIIYLTTSPVAVFSLDDDLSHDNVTFSNKNCTMTTSSFENRVALGNVGLSRGQHYWEVTLDRYEGNPDPAIGVAQEDCAKDVILGKDSKAWSIYVDSNRSWFQHNNAHLYRSEGGVDAGSVIGLYLDLDNCQISFYCNDVKHGPIEFPSLEDVDVVYPAFSLNRNVTMTLHTGITPPTYLE